MYLPRTTGLAPAPLGALWILAGATLISSCSGDALVFKDAEADSSVAIVEARLDPPDPSPLVEPTAVLRARAASDAHVLHAVADADALDTGALDFGAVDYLRTSLTLEVEPDAAGVATYTAQLPRRAEDEALLVWFEVIGADGDTLHWPVGGGDAPWAIAARPIEIDFPWPDWPSPDFDLPCRADRARVFDGAEDEATLAPGFPFEVIREPIWTPAGQASVLGNIENITRGIGVEAGGRAYFFPLAVMLWNEVSNQTLGSRRTAMSYCPLTDTALYFDTGFDPAAPPKWHDYAPAGLFNSNLSVGIEGLDPARSSAFNQMLGFAFTGPRTGECLTPLPAVMVEFGVWRQLHPETLVLEGDPAHVDEFDYTSRSNPYAQYWSNAEIRFPVARQDGRYPPKQRVMGLLVADDPVAIPLLGAQTLHHTTSGGIEVLVIDLATLTVALERRHPLTGETLRFRRTPATWRGTPLLEDDSADPSLWTIEGVAVSGPAKGTRLAWVPSMSAFWFAWYALYPESRVEEPSGS